MAQPSQSEETRGTGDTGAAGAGGPQGLFGSSTTILLIIFAVAVFWWSRRRRVEMEERLRDQRRDAEETAQRSALDVAHLMRSAPQPAAAAAAKEGLASAVPIRSAGVAEPAAQSSIDTRRTFDDDALSSAQTPTSDAEQEAQARASERNEARAAADRAAEEQAERAARDAETEGESLVRRMAAATAAAHQAGVDTAEIEQAGRDTTVPAGAVPGDGTVNCPPDYLIKGNRQSHIYHRPGQVSYPSTVAEYCFQSPEAAEAAGYRQSRARAQRT
jgi:hypothetical protein